MTQLENIYSVMTGRFYEHLCSVDNEFIKRLYNVALNSAHQLKRVSFILPNAASKRGDVAKRGVSAADKSVLNACLLKTLSGAPGCETLMDDLALYRSLQLGIHQETPDFTRYHATMLMVDYLLASSLCYVEVFDDNGASDKFLATRNRYIAGMLAGKEPDETRKYISYLTTYRGNYEEKKLKCLKINPLRKGYSITQPRTSLDFQKNITVTPVFLLTAFVDGLRATLQTKMLRIRYLKDNLTERELVTSLSPQLLATVYDHERVDMLLGTSDSTLNLKRGYLKLPEVGLSKYDASGLRSLNLARITSIEEVFEVDRRFLDVDFAVILPTFKETVSNCRDPRVLGKLYLELFSQAPPQVSLPELRSMVNSGVSSRVDLMSTTALRELHLYMVANPAIFTMYHGGQPRTISFDPNIDFNFGLSND